MENTALITVKALPEIQENLRALRERWDQKAAEAASMVCTEETVQTIKKMRAEMRDEFTQADTQRKAAKAMYLAPWNAVEETFKDCVSDAFKRADASFKNTIDEFEGEIKAKCRKDLEGYFAELCTVYDIDFLSFDQALALGKIKIRLADAKKNTPRQLQDALSAVVAKIADGIDQINQMDEADRAEVMAEYKTEFDVGCAVAKMQARRRRVQAEAEAAELRIQRQKATQNAVAKVDAVATTLPTETSLPEPLKRETGKEQIFEEFSFTVFNCTRTQLIKIRDYLKQEGIAYE